MMHNADTLTAIVKKDYVVTFSARLVNLNAQGAQARFTQGRLHTC